MAPPHSQRASPIDSGIQETTAERADRLVRHERSLAAHETALAHAQETAAWKADGRWREVHLLAARIHKEAALLHEEVADVHQGHADQHRNDQ